MKNLLIALMLSMGVCSTSPADGSPTRVNPKIQDPIEMEQAALTSVGNVYHVAQMTGDSAPVSTLANWKVAGTDIGTMFLDSSGTVFLAFGDTFDIDGTDWRNNALARSTDTSPSNGLTIDSMVTDVPGHAKTIIPKNSDFTTIPTSGVSVGDNLYIHYQRIKLWTPIRWQVFGSGIAISTDNGENWTRTDMWSSRSNFAQGAFYKTDGYVYMFGIPAGRLGCAKLARVVESNILVLGAYEYRTNSGWGTKEKDAVCVVPAPIGEFSVNFNDYLGQYIMTYLGNTTIEIRTAPELTGPWSSPLAITDGTVYPLLYAPMLHPVYSKGQDIYFALSVWEPYNTFLIHATLNPTSEQWGPFEMPGRVEAENYLEGGEGVGYHDTTSGNFGEAYRTDDVDVLLNNLEGYEDLHQIGWTESGEWLKYAIDVSVSGTYKFRLKYSSAVAGCTMKLSSSDDTTTYVPATSINGTGAWTEFELWEPSDTFDLTQGVQNIRLTFVAGGCDITFLEIYPSS